MEGFEAILNDVNVWADNRDAIYIESDHFQFKSDDDFIILYGVNHEQTGKSDLLQCKLLWSRTF
ncbi:hypothetical protein GCM10020331_014000 [Ectobacillus funiculus]